MLDTTRNIMDKFLKFIEEWWVVFSALGVVVGIWMSRLKVVFTISKKIWKVVVLFARFPMIIEERLTKQDAKLAMIEKELTPNGGGSLKDIVKNTNDLVLVSDLRTKQMIVVHPIPMYECEPINGKCISANIALCELFGLDEPRMLGNGWLTAVDPHDRQLCWDGYQKAIQSDIPFSWEYNIINQRTHMAVMCRTEMCVLRDTKGRPILYQGFVEPKK